MRRQPEYLRLLPVVFGHAGRPDGDSAQGHRRWWLIGMILALAFFLIGISMMK